MTYKRGDVLLVSFPFADLVTYKQRPALVVHGDAAANPNGDHILVAITSNVTRPGRCNVEIQQGSPEFVAMGLLHDSLVVADKLNTVEPFLIKGKLGTCPVMESVDDALRRALGL